MKKISRVEVPSATWLPAASHYGSLLESNGVKYAIFGAGALAVHEIMVRPTIDIDFVVNEYEKTVELLKTQPDLSSTNLQKERDGIQVADFYFKSGITVQIWDNNLYSLPMTDDSWSRIVNKPVPGFNAIWCISMEDLIISKVGRYIQQVSDSQYEAEKNAKDIVVTMQVISNPDFQYILQRLMEGARREKSSKTSKIHPLDWYFVREVGIYREISESFDRKKIGTFIANILIKSKFISTEYFLLHNIRKGNSISQFQSSFMLDEKSISTLLNRWKQILKVDGDKVSISSSGIQDYLKSLPSEKISEYSNQLIFSGKTK